MKRKEETRDKHRQPQINLNHSWQLGHPLLATNYRATPDMIRMKTKRQKRAQSQQLKIRN